MSKKVPGSPGDWAKHLKPKGKRASAKGNRQWAKGDIENEYQDIIKSRPVQGDMIIETISSQWQWMEEDSRYWLLVSNPVELGKEWYRAKVRFIGKIDWNGLGDRDLDFYSPGIKKPEVKSFDFEDGGLQLIKDKTRIKKILKWEKLYNLK